MDWTKISIKTSAAGVEAVTSALLAAGVVGMEVVDPATRVRDLREAVTSWDYAEDALMDALGDTFVLFYTTADDAGAAVLSRVRQEIARVCEFLPHIPVPEISQENADDASWRDEWKKHFKPLRIGGITIVPQWEDYTAAAGEKILRIDPGSAFGTGQHATTALCLQAMQAVPVAGKNVLDLGCGSGILAIAAALLGAAGITAVDIDPAGAIAATRKNAGLNGITHIQTVCGDVLSDAALRQNLRATQPRIILANIVADVIIPLAPHAFQMLPPHGVFICSGIIHERANEVFRTLTHTGFSLLHTATEQGWTCFTCEKGEQHA
jgi:ribosomal protein L11 methyltransferase